MSGDLLREAAAKMRERAEAAVSATGDEPWVFTGMGYDALADGATYNVGSALGVHVCMAATEEQAEHVMGWHPAVALAVADWLDGCAHDYAENLAIWQFAATSGDHVEAWEHKTPESNAEYHWREALSVARAYLGRDA